LGQTHATHSRRGGPLSETITAPLKNRKRLGKGKKQKMLTEWREKFELTSKRKTDSAENGRQDVSVLQGSGRHRGPLEGKEGTPRRKRPDHGNQQGRATGFV